MDGEVLTSLNKGLVGEALQLNGQRETLFVHVHATVLALHALLGQTPQKVVADLTPGGRLKSVHL